jgi:hypothetical protein
LPDQAHAAARVGRTLHGFFIAGCAAQYIAAVKPLAGRFRAHHARARHRGERKQMDRGFHIAHAWPPHPMRSL